MNVELAARTIPDPSKERNGDAFVHTVPDGSAVFAMIADGVGSCPCDWLASQTACERFAELAKSVSAIATDPAGSLQQMLQQIDRDIHATASRGRGMKCAATAVLSFPDTNRAWFANVGDTRLYRFVDPELVQISHDDSQAIVRRGPDGKPLLSGGATVVQRGITNALGSGDARVTVNSVSVPEGGALVLCSDGFYECSPEFAPEITRVLCHAELDDVLAVLCESYRGRNRDDATALILRRDYPALNDAQLENAIGGGGGGHPRHAVAAAIEARLPDSVAKRDENRVRGFLDHLDHSNLVIGKARVEKLLKQMGVVRWRDRQSFQLLVEMLRQQS
jgi:serine/threonine protein phosphatase PrpC